MAIDPFAKVKPGDNLPAFPAQFYNDMQDMLRWWKGNPFGGGGGASSDEALEASRTILSVKNSTGIDVPWHGILRVETPIFTYASNNNGYKNRCTMVGLKPDATYDQRFVITRQPIGNGRVGLAHLAGVVQCQIDVVDASDKFADVINNDVTKLRSSAWGCCPILEKESGTGTKWGKVLLGSFTRQTVLGKATEFKTHGNFATFTVLKPQPASKGGEVVSSGTLSAFVRKGLVMPDAYYTLAPMCPAVDGVYEVADPALSLVGKTDSSVTKGNSVTVSVWSAWSGSLADSTHNVTVTFLAQAAGSGKWVHATWNGTTGDWEGAAEC